MYFQRQACLEKLIRHKDKDLVKVITGIRRCGKSVLLFEIFNDYLLENGVPAERIVKVNLETGKNAALRDGNALYAHISEQILNGEKHYVFIDEIQLVEHFEDVVNGLRVDFNADIYITGSNSKLLSKDIHTKMRGRSIEIRVFPLSFAEFFAAKSGDVRKIFNEYLMFGGLPYLLSENDEKNKSEYLKMICETVVTSDIVERHGIRHGNVFDAVVDFLCSNIGSYVSANKIANTLNSAGYKKITPDTIGAYLEFVCDAFLFYKAQRYDIKGKSYLKTLNKYYISDLGIRNRKLNFRQLEITHSIENIVYLELLRRGYVVDIGKNADKEIDFVARDGGNVFYIQVAYTLISPETREREISAFRKINDAYKKIILTMDDDPFDLLENGYKKMNLLDFLLNERALEEA